MILKSENRSFPRLSLSGGSSVGLSEPAERMKAGCVISSYQEDDLEVAEVDIPEERDECCSLDWLE